MRLFPVGRGDSGVVGRVEATMTMTGDQIEFATYHRTEAGVSCGHCGYPIRSSVDVSLVRFPGWCTAACQRCQRPFRHSPPSKWFAVTKETPMTDDQLREKVKGLPFFQGWHLRPGVHTGGPHDVERMLGLLGLPERLDGLDVLDIGTNDGFFAFTCESRGARSVIALDHPQWAMAGHGVSKRAAFDFAQETLGSNVQPVVCPLEDLHPRVLKPWIESGRFDLVLLLGVLYHLPDPLGGLEKAAAMLEPGGQIILETHLDCLDVPRPAMAFYPGREFNDDQTNWFGFNPACVTAMMAAAGLVGGREVARYEYGPNITALHPHVARGVFHARKPDDARSGG